MGWTHYWWANPATIDCEQREAAEIQATERMDAVDFGPWIAPWARLSC